MSEPEGQLYCLEAERSLLGAILVKNEAYHEVDAFLTKDHFFESRHQKLYEIVSCLVRLNKVANSTTVTAFSPTDREYLAELAMLGTTEAFPAGEACSLGIEIHALYFLRLPEAGFKEQVSAFMRFALSEITELRSSIRPPREMRPTDHASEVAAFRKHLNQGYAMLKRMEEES